MTHHETDDHAAAGGDDGGMVPSQWAMRILGVTVLGTLAAALLGSLDDIKRYLKIRRM